MIRRTITFCALLAVATALSIFGQQSNSLQGGYQRFGAVPDSPADNAFPFNQVCTHRVNNMYLSVTNFGCFGSFLGLQLRDCETNLYAPSRS